MIRRAFSALSLVLILIIFSGCETVPSEDAARRAAMEAAIRSEVPGNYYVGRRFYKKDYKMWGWVREPGRQWNTAKLVMLNEQQTLAPDRQAGSIGSDNNTEYLLRGGFSGDTVYEPASDRFYPEFVLTSYEVRSTNPAPIFKDPRSIDPTVRLLTPPM